MTSSNGSYGQVLHEAAHVFQRTHLKYRRRGSSTAGKRLQVAVDAEVANFAFMNFIEPFTETLFSSLPEAIHDATELTAGRQRLRSLYRSRADELWNIGAIFTPHYHQATHLSNDVEALLESLSDWFRSEIKGSMSLSRKGKAKARRRACHRLAVALCSVTQAVAAQEGRPDGKTDHARLASTAFACAREY